MNNREPQEREFAFLHFCFPRLEVNGVFFNGFLVKCLKWSLQLTQTNEIYIFPFHILSYDMKYVGKYPTFKAFMRL